jgi:anti-sigma-K factor RskA
MMTENRERLEELLAGYVTGDITSEEQAELRGLLEGLSASEIADWELAAGELTASFLEEESSAHPLPEHLVQAVVTQGRISIAGPEDTTGAKVVDISTRRRPNLLAWTGWAAAAVAALFIWTSSDGISTTPQPGTATALRDSLLATDGNLIQLAWTATEDQAALGASGDVVWSDLHQTGVMRFQGLQLNDPTQWQYQLWIFDAARDERFPVDGGVFDIPSAGGEVLVPIDARLQVGQATLFAVTVERPGGVVVSDRERIVMVAQVT